MRNERLRLYTKLPVYQLNSLLLTTSFLQRRGKKINHRCRTQTLTVFFEMKLTRTSRSQAVVSCAEINPNGLLHRVKEDLAVTTPEKINKTIEINKTLEVR